MIQNRARSDHTREIILQAALTSIARDGLDAS
jgi:DNA-binding transcriptional regulator YbjK